MRFADRTDAGQRLASALAGCASAEPVVLGLPCGGVPVAAEVARALRAPLDVLVVRKLGVPDQPELAMGALGEDGVRVLNEAVLLRVDDDELAAVESRERAALDRRCRRLRGERPAVPLTGRTVLIVDDGIATGATARAACRVARARGAARVVLAAPVAPLGLRARLADVADEVVCLQEPRAFRAVGGYYADFRSVPEAEVAALLTNASGRPATDG